MDGQDDGSSWTTRAGWGKLHVETQNKYLAIGIVVIVLTVIVWLVARDLLGALWSFLSVWAGSAFLLLCLTLMIGWFEREQAKRRKGRILPWIAKNPKLFALLLAGTALLMAMASTGQAPPAP